MAAAGSELQQTASILHGCTFVGALCIGIDEYEYLPSLPKAREDAEQFSRGLISKGLPESSLRLLVGKVCKSELEAVIKSFLERFLEVAESSECPGTEPQLIVISVASHGRQPESSEMPAILASDAVSPKSDVGSIDVDSQICKPLDSVTGRKLKVLLVIDTCRENDLICTWTGNAKTPMKRKNWRSKTDFRFMLACDKGRYASEDQSLTAALVRELQDPNKDVVADLDAACRGAAKQIEEQSSGKQRPVMIDRGDFSGSRPKKEVESGRTIPLLPNHGKVLFLAAGMQAAFLVVLLFWVLLQHVDMTCTAISHEQRHRACPANSCFCTDCDPSNMLLNMFLTHFGEASEDSVSPHVSNRSTTFLSRCWTATEDAVSPHVSSQTVQRPWEAFSCKLGLELNRCWITLWFNFLWLGLTLRLAWRVRSLLRECSTQTGLLHVAWITCGLCATSAVRLLKPFLPSSIRHAIVTLKYFAIGTLLLASGLFGPLGLLLRPKERCHPHDNDYDSLASDFLKSFLIFAFVGEIGIMLHAASTDSTGEKVVMQQHMFYSIYLLLGLLVVCLQCRNFAREDQKIYDVLRKLRNVKLVWLAFRFLFWWGACSKFRQLAINYDFFMVWIERTGVWWTVSLLVQFAQHVHKVQLSLRTKLLQVQLR